MHDICRIRRIVSLGTALGGAALCLFAQAQADSAKRKITDKDLFQFQWIGDPVLSPDGSRAVFVKVRINDKRTGYETSLWLLDLKQARAEPREITRGSHDSAPCWSPDGTQLAFVRTAEQDDKLQPPQIYLLSFAGGEPRALTSLTHGAGSPLFSPDGKHLLFSSTTSPEDMQKAAHKAGDKPEEHVSDVRVITHAMYRMNGEGYIDYEHPNHLWVVDTPPLGTLPGTARQLTSGRFSESDPVWATNSDAVYFLTVKQDEPYYRPPSNELDRVDAKGGEPVPVTSFPFAAHSLAVSPDGQQIAFRASISEGEKSYSQPDLWVMTLASDAKPRNLTVKYDFDIGTGVAGDNAAPRAAGTSKPLWTKDGQSLIDISGKQGEANLVSVNVGSGEVKDLTHGRQAVELVSQSADRAHLVGLISTSAHLADLYTISDDGVQEQRTDLNSKLFDGLDLTEPEEIWFRSFDGRRIQMWVQKPPDFDPARKYPLILDIHGGPHAAYGWVFDHEFQWMAAQGYVVVYPNPRGSTTYGQEFGNIIQHRYPGDDYRDLMTAVDEVVKRGYVDPRKLGVTGGSGGGVLTDWTVTHTNRFKAAVSQRDISDWTSWWYTDDFLLFQPTWFKGAPFDQPDDFRNRSAITFVKRIQTPMMFILGDADYRTPPTSGGEQLFRALKYMKEPTVMLRFPGESHELSRSGQPWHRVERLDGIVGWFDKYLKAESRPEYDVVPGILPQPPVHAYGTANPAVQ